MASRWVFLQLFLVAFTLAFPAHDLHQRGGGPSRPANDDFYTLPDGFESAPPGTILRSRTPPYPIAAFSLAKVNLDAAYQIMYRTTDSFGKPTAAVSTILVPHNADYTKLLSYQSAIDAADPNCAPSYAFQLDSASEGGPLGLIMPQLELLFIATALDKGWVVTVPDHLGLKSAFLANNLSGHSTLDNIRAALASSHFTKISPDSTISMWGYSGGSLATGFAAELQPSYAPELKIAGAALGGTVPRILPVINTVTKGPFAGLVPAGIQGLANEYPDIAQIVEDNLIPSKKAEFYKTRNLCLGGDLKEYFAQDIYSYIKNSSIFTIPAAVEVINTNSMGQRFPKTPLLIYKSVGDEVSPVSDTDALYTTYCNNGVNLEYKRDLFSEHASMAIVGAPDAMIWLNDRMNGVPVKQGCKKTTRLTSFLDPGAIEVLGVTILEILGSLLGAPLGPLTIG